MRLYFARFIVIVGFCGVCWLDRQETRSQEQPAAFNVPMQNQQPPPNQGDANAVQQGVEVQARGPVHEAFATPIGEPKPTGTVNKKPPPQLDEMAVGSSRVDLQACKLEYSIVSPK